MKEYQQYINKLADSDNNMLFYNSGPKHAAIVMGAILEHAKKIVKIFAGNLFDEVANTAVYKRGIEDFLTRGGQLQILVQIEKLKEEPEIFNLLRFYASYNPEQIIVKKHPFKVQKSGSQEIHFTIADDKMYRLEEDIDNFKATGNFNDPTVSKILSEIFDDIFQRDESKPISLIQMHEVVG